MSYCDVAKARQQVYNAARPAMHTAQHCTVPSVPQRAALYSVQRDESRKKMPYMCHATIQRAQENALHVPCDHTARRCPALHCIANIVQRSVLAAVSPSQVKPSAAASGGTTRKTLQKVCAPLQPCDEAATIHVYMWGSVTCGVGQKVFTSQVTAYIYF
jgi:hypothetical protein